MTKRCYSYFFQWLLARLDVEGGTGHDIRAFVKSIKIETRVHVGSHDNDVIIIIKMMIFFSLVVLLATTTTARRDGRAAAGCLLTSIGWMARLRNCLIDNGGARASGGTSQLFTEPSVTNEGLGVGSSWQPTPQLDQQQVDTSSPYSL